MLGQITIFPHQLTPILLKYFNFYKKQPTTAQIKNIKKYTKNAYFFDIFAIFYLILLIFNKNAKRITIDECRLIKKYGAPKIAG